MFNNHHLTIINLYSWQLYKSDLLLQIAITQLREKIFYIFLVGSYSFNNNKRKEQKEV